MMRCSVVASIALGAVLGCGGGSKKEPIDFGESLESPPTPPPSEPVAPAQPKAPATCAGAGENVERITRHVSTALASTLVERCQQDRWPPEVVACAAAAGDGPGLSLCLAMLPPEHRAALESKNVAVVRGDDPACAELRATAPAGQDGNAVPDVQKVPGLPQAAAPVRHTIAATALEALRLSGDKQLTPAVDELRLMARCKVSRVVAAFKVCIDTAGVPVLVELVKTSRLPKYDEKLAEGIATWRYRPFVVDGRPAAACGPVTFLYAAS